jgi:hypothetical protein
MSREILHAGPKAKEAAWGNGGGDYSGDAEKLMHKSSICDRVYHGSAQLMAADPAKPTGPDDPAAQRDVAEEQRNLAEQQRDVAEKQRDVAEKKRDVAEEQRDVAEGQREVSEERRDESEQVRRNAEHARQTAEDARNMGVPPHRDGPSEGLKDDN